MIYLGLNQLFQTQVEPGALDMSKYVCIGVCKGEETTY